MYIIISKAQWEYVYFKPDIQEKCSCISIPFSNIYLPIEILKNVSFWNAFGTIEIVIMAIISVKSILIFNLTFFSSFIYYITPFIYKIIVYL